MSALLSQKKIWVTRPRHQAENLCCLLEEKEAIPVRFPVLQISPILDNGFVLSCFSSLEKYDYVIFISQNAVELAFSHYIKQSPSGQSRYVAIGQSTADKLKQFNVEQVLQADAGADSEALLAISEFQQQSIQDKSVLLVRGVGGRALLQDVLSERGARIDVVEVYKRDIPVYTDQEVAKFWHDHSPDAIIVTSNEAIQNLWRLTAETNRDKLFGTDLIVMSDRNADYAKQRGFNSTISAAKEKNDAGLLQALESLFGDKQ